MLRICYFSFGYLNELYVPEFSVKNPWTIIRKVVCEEFKLLKQQMCAIKYIS